MHMVLTRLGHEDGLEHLDPARVLKFWRTCDIDPQAQLLAAQVPEPFQAKHNFGDIIDRLPAKYIHAVREMDPGQTLVRHLVTFVMSLTQCRWIARSCSMSAHTVTCTLGHFDSLHGRMMSALYLHCSCQRLAEWGWSMVWSCARCWHSSHSFAAHWA